MNNGPELVEYDRKWRKEHQERCDFYNTRRYERNREKIIEQNREWDRLNIAAKRARQVLRIAVKGGAVERPSKCSECGGIGDIQGHHEDYSLPLSVIWLCRSCHKRFHFNYFGELTKL